MKLLGKRVLLTVPRKKESFIELTPETEKQLELDMIQEWTALEVYAIGSDATIVKPGDKVYVPVGALSSAERIMIADEAKLMINEFEISIIWDNAQNVEKRKGIDAIKRDRQYSGKEKEVK